MVFSIFANVLALGTVADLDVQNLYNHVTPPLGQTPVRVRFSFQSKGRLIQSSYLSLFENPDQCR